MPDFLLIHGASHGAWCWRDVVPCLEAMGHTVRAIDLPGHGEDPTPPESVTLEDYVAAALAALGEDTVLVGHSLGGLTITLAAARAPERIRALVYLAAFVPEPGESFAELRRGAITPELEATRRDDRERGLSHVIPEAAGPVFYSDCDEAVRAYAVPRLSPEPVAPLRTALDFTPPDVPRHYIRCLRDRVVRPEYQRAASASWPEGRVHEMDCGHSPFFADPDRLGRILDGIATA